MIPHLELKVDDLANFVFVKNVNNAVIQLELDGLRDAYDMFCFCVDLLCKGLVILYGGEDQKLDIDALTMEQFLHIRQKMLCMGFDVHLDASPNSEAIKPCITIVQRIDRDINTIKQFSLKIVSPLNKYIITFELTHTNTLTQSCKR